MNEQPPASSPAVWWSPEYQRFYALPGTPPLVEEVETRFMPSDIQPMVPDTGQARETARHREGSEAGWPRVAGRCPGCNRASLFLAAGEHVTCSHLNCPAPCAADDLLHPVTQSGGTAPVPTAEIAGWDGAA